MKKKLLALLLVVFQLMVCFSVYPAVAYAEDATATATATDTTIPFSDAVEYDGTIASGEYTDAWTTTLTEGKATAEVYMVNDGTNIYIAARVEQTGGITTTTATGAYSIVSGGTAFGLIAGEKLHIYATPSSANGYVTKGAGNWDTAWGTGAAEAKTTLSDDGSYFVTEIKLSGVTTWQFTLSDADSSTASYAGESITYTLGEAICAHNWVEATCAAPKTCTLCGETEGEVGTHTYVNGSCPGCGAFEVTTPTIPFGAVTLDGVIADGEYANALFTMHTYKDATAKIYMVNNGSYVYIAAKVTQTSGIDSTGDSGAWYTPIVTSSSFGVRANGSGTRHWFGGPAIPGGAGNYHDDVCMAECSVVDANTYYVELAIPCAKFEAWGPWCFCVSTGNGELSANYSAYTTFVLGENTCDHSTINAVAAVPSTCTVKGTIAHYACADCGATYSDAEGTTPISDISAALDATNHNDADSDNFCDACGALAGNLDIPYGAPTTIDGVKDSAYDKALVIPANSILTSTNAALANVLANSNVYILHDGDFIYVYFDIKGSGFVAPGDYTAPDPWAAYSSSSVGVSTDGSYYLALLGPMTDMICYKTDPNCPQIVDAATYGITSDAAAGTYAVEFQLVADQFVLDLNSRDTAQMKFFIGEGTGAWSAAATLNLLPDETLNTEIITFDDLATMWGFIIGSTTKSNNEYSAYGLVGNTIEIQQTYGLDTAFSTTIELLNPVTGKIDLGFMAAIQNPDNSIDSTARWAITLLNAEGEVVEQVIIVDYNDATVGILGGEGLVWTGKAPVDSVKTWSKYSYELELSDVVTQVQIGYVDGDKGSYADSSVRVYLDNLTITADPDAEPIEPETPVYNAAISTSTETVKVGDTVTFDVTVDATYAAAQLTLTYDPATLTLKEVTSSAAGTTVSEPVIDNGTVTVTVFGDDAADAVITFTFTAAAAGDATVTLTEAAFSTQANADGDLTAANITTATATVTVEAEEVVLESIAVNTLPTTTDYLYNGTTALIFDTTGLAIDLVYSDGTTETITEGFTVSGFNATPTAYGPQTITVTYEGLTTTFEVTVLLKINSAAVILGNDLTITFMFNKSYMTDWTGTYAVIEKVYADGTETLRVEIPFEEWEYTASNGRYVVYFNGIAAKEMGDAVSITICDANGNAISNTQDYSILQYAKNQLGKSTTAANVKKLLVDMLNYGAAAQSYFTYDVENLVNADLTEAQKALATQTTPTLENNRVAGTGGYAKGTAIELETNIVLNFNFLTTHKTTGAALPEGVYAVVTYYSYHDSTTLNEVPVELENIGGGVLCAKLETLVCADARQIVTCTLYDAEGNVIDTIQESIESYAQRQINSGAETAPLCEAMMKFTDSAKDYLTSK